MRRQTRLLALLLLTVFVVSACNTLQRYTESGDYDAAIELCLRKLRGKSKKKTEYVKGLEEAFARAQTRDLRAIDALLYEERPENWEKINAIHRKIRERQQKIAPLTPLRSKSGYQAKFAFLDIAKMEIESRQKAAEFLYSRAENLLLRADKGDKPAAREAYNVLEKLEECYYRNYKNTAELKQDARALGTTHVLFEIKNQSDKVLPRAFNDRVLAIGKNDLDSEWKSYHFTQEPGIRFDYRAVFNIRRVDVSPERVLERNYVDEKEIQDGWNYVLDARGNVKKDSLGNDIKTPRMVRIRAAVVEIHQTKAVRLSGTVDVFDAARNTRLESNELGTEVVFENYASTFTGDERALSADTRRRIGNRPLPFPPDEDMLIQAADRLKPDIRESLRRSRAML